MNTLNRTLMLGAAIFWFAAGPVGVYGGKPALLVFGLGVLISGGCVLSAHAVARIAANRSNRSNHSNHSNHSNKSEMWVAALGAPVRMLTVAAGVLVLYWLTEVNVIYLLSVIALTYPMFLIPSALWLTEELNLRHEARTA